MSTDSPARGAADLRSAPWFPVNVAAWLDIADALTQAGNPWPLWAIYTDLRWWADQERVGRGSRPGRPALRRRWHVSDRAVRNALKSEDQWADPLRGADSKRTASGQRADSDTPASVQDDNPGRTASGQRADSDRPHARSTQIHTTHDTLTPEPLVGSPDPSAGKPASPEPHWTVDLWAQLQAIRADHVDGARGQGLTKARRANLIARTRDLREAGMTRDDLLRAARWVFTSDAMEAQGARSTADPLKVLLRPSHVVDYCEAAREAGDGARVRQPAQAERPRDEAATAWQQILAALAQYGKAAASGAPPRVRAAAEAVGGIAGLAGMNEYQRSRCERAFCDAYRQAPTLALVGEGT